MAGRHGVPAPERRTHARQASGQRRSRAQRRDAAQPWALWLALRGFLALVVLAAMTWSVILLTQGRGGVWPVIALVAGAMSLVMIGLDVRARRRQRARWAAAQAVPHRGRRTAGDQRDQRDQRDHALEADAGFVPEPPPVPLRRSHRR